MKIPVLVNIDLVLSSFSWEMKIVLFVLMMTG